MELMELLKTRRTYRRFAQKEISQEIVGEILEGGKACLQRCQQAALKLYCGKQT